VTSPPNGEVTVKSGDKHPRGRPDSLLMIVSGTPADIGLLDVQREKRHFGAGNGEPMKWKIGLYILQAKTLGTRRGG